MLDLRALRIVILFRFKISSGLLNRLSPPTLLELLVTLIVFASVSLHTKVISWNVLPFFFFFFAHEIVHLGTRQEKQTKAQLYPQPSS